MRAVLFILAGLVCFASVAAAAGAMPYFGSGSQIEARAIATSVAPEMIAEPELPEEPCACQRSGVCGQQQPAISGGSSDLFARIMFGIVLRPPGALGWFSPFVADLDPPPPRLTSA